MRAADPKRYVRGQYEGFLDVEDVAPDSTTETFAAVELEVDNWRWSGVPFFIRAGKCMPAKSSEVTVVFKRPPQPRDRRRQDAGTEPDDDPDRADCRARGCASTRRRPARRPSSRPTSRFCSRRRPARSPSPTSACSATRSPAAITLFTRQDAIEETWRVVQPLLDEPGPVPPLRPGTWGPEQAKDLTRGIAQWSEPWLPEPISGSDVLGF